MDTDMAKNIGRAKYVKKEREDRAWPQRQLAEVAGVNLRTIQRLERDGAASFDTLMGVAQAFGIDVKLLNPSSRTPAKSDPTKKVYLLPRLTTGSELADVINCAGRFQIEHDTADDKRALNAMINILNELKGDILKWHDADPVGKLKTELYLTQAIDELDSYGFYLFGIKREVKNKSDRQGNPIALSTIYLSHSRSPKIVQNKNSNMVIPAILTEELR